MPRSEFRPTEDQAREDDFEKVRFVRKAHRDLMNTTQKVWDKTIDEREGRKEVHAIWDRLAQHAAACANSTT